MVVALVIVCAASIVLNGYLWFKLQVAWFCANLAKNRYKVLAETAGSQVAWWEHQCQLEHNKYVEAAEFIEAHLEEQAPRDSGETTILN